MNKRKIDKVDGSQEGGDCSRSSLQRSDLEHWDSLPPGDYKSIRNLPYVLPSDKEIKEVKSQFEMHKGKKEIYLVSDDEEVDNDIIINKFNVDLKRSDFNRLKAKIQLNDEIVNFYMEMLNAREDKLASTMGVERRRAHCFSSYMVEKLFNVEKDSYNFQNVQRWTKNINVFQYDKLIFPVHLKSIGHWTLIVVDLQNYRIIWMDSLSTMVRMNSFTLSICRWLNDVAMNQPVNRAWCGKPWNIVSFPNLPQQNNGYDCGVFVLAYATMMIDNPQLLVNQKWTDEDMSKFRLKIAHSIMKGEFTR